MKTLAQLKKDLFLGQIITLTSHIMGKNPKIYMVKRYVVKVCASYVELNTDKNATSGSRLDFYKASLMDYYDGGKLILFDNIKDKQENKVEMSYIIGRELTNEERDGKL